MGEQGALGAPLAATRMWSMDFGDEATPFMFADQLFVSVGGDIAIFENAASADFIELLEFAK